MPSIQGEFASRAAAQNAVDRLTVAGIPRDHIRLWNIIPDGRPSGSDSGAAGGAMIGGLLGGAVGLGLGAAAGAALAGAYGDEAHLPLPSGVRVVVDSEPGDPDVASLLREAGAVRIRAINT